MTKSRTLRKAGAVALSLAMAMSIVGVTPASAAAKKVTLSKAKGTIKVGKTATVKIKGTKKANIKKVTFKYTKKNIAKATRKNLKIKITGLKAGKTTVKAVVKLKKKVGTKKKYTLKYVATVKKATEPVVEELKLTGVSLSSVAPVVGETLNAVLDPAKASNVASYKWFSGDTADNTVNEIAGETTSSLKVTSDLLSKFIKVVVTDSDGKEFSATTTAAVIAQSGTLEAKQTGANTIVATSGSELSATDKVVVKKGSTEQTITYALGEDKKTVTITTSTKIAADDYTVEITPTDTGLAKITASLKGEAEKLAGLNFGKELALISATNFYSVQTTVKGANQWSEDYNLGSGTVTVYPSVAIAAAGAETTANAWDGNTQTNFNAKTGVYTLVKGGTIPFQIGDKVNFTAIYTSGTTVVQSTAELAVANVPYVASMEFGALASTNAKLKDKRVTVSNFRKGTYYVPVVAKDQYGNTLDADALNAKVAAQSLFINPSDTQGAYGGFDDVANGGDGFTKLDDGTIAMNVGAKADSLPGECVITIAGLGGLSTSTKFTIEDDPYIATLNVVVPGSLYQSTTAEFTVEATDQYGDPVVLYDQNGITKANAGLITLGDYNNLTKGTSSISVSSGTLAFERNSAKKAVVFKYTPDAAAVTDVMTITTAVPKVETKTLSIGSVGKAASIQKTLDTTKPDSALTITSGKDVDFGKALVFVDTNGEVITEANAAIQKPEFIGAAVSTVDTVTSGASTGEVNVGKVKYFYTISVGSTPVYETAPKVTNIIATTTYTVSLYEVTGAASAGTDNATAKLLDSKDFKVTVTETNATGNKYESYTAEVNAGDELLYNANVTNEATPTALPTSVIDKATIVVKGADANGKEATLSEGTDYTLTVDSGLNVYGSDIKAAPSTKALAAGATASEGEATITVWDAQSGNQVATCKLKYSNANPKAEKWGVTKAVGDTNGDTGVEQASAASKSAFTGDTVDVENAAVYYGVRAEGAVKICDNPKTTNYLVECKNQYGTRFTGVKVNVGGAEMVNAGSTALTNTTTSGKKYTFQLTAGGIETFNFYAVVKTDPVVVAAYEAAKTDIDAINLSAGVTLTGSNASVSDSEAHLKDAVKSAVETEVSATTNSYTVACTAVPDPINTATSGTNSCTVTISKAGYTKTFTVVATNPAS